MYEFYSAVIWIMAGILGLCFGSFLNVVIYRVPENMSLCSPASHCPECGYVLKWYDNIPVLSYILLKGKCRNCKTHISFRYTAVEVLNTLLWVISAVIFRDDLIYAGCLCAVCSVALIVSCIDLEHMMIPDRFHLIIAGIALVAVPFDKSTSHWSHLIGGAAIFVIMLLISLIMEKALGREALGGGDIKLCAVCGLFLGWEKLLLMMILSSVAASVVLLIARGKNGESREYPFGPFLCGGMIISALCGEYIINWYLSFIK